MHAGVCVIRFEAEPDRWLITMTVIFPLGDDNRELARERVQHFSDPERAIATITERLKKAFGTGRPNRVDVSVNSPLEPPSTSRGRPRPEQ